MCHKINVSDECVNIFIAILIKIMKLFFVKKPFSCLWFRNESLTVCWDLTYTWFSLYLFTFPEYWDKSYSVNISIFHDKLMSIKLVILQLPKGNELFCSIRMPYFDKSNLKQFRLLVNRYHSNEHMTAITKVAQLSDNLSNGTVPFAPETIEAVWTCGT